MPTKCIDQMPVPSASEPPSHQLRASDRLPARTRLARSSATNEEKPAMKIDSATPRGRSG